MGLIIANKVSYLLPVITLPLGLPLVVAVAVTTGGELLS